MEKVEYYIYNPGGNQTALVIDNHYNLHARKYINDLILKKHKNVEQVGFLTKDTYELKMAGGEFCGNATRCAVLYYLTGKTGEIKININKELVDGGIYENGEVWCEVPLYFGTDVFEKMDEGIYKIKMNGMTALVISEDISKKYLVDISNIKEYGIKFISHYHLEECEAVGVMFLEKINLTVKINPVVWVRDIDTLFYESACGSGTTAVAMLEAFLNRRSQVINILQPSGYTITSEIKYESERIVSARISGVVEADNAKKVICLLEEYEVGGNGK